MAESGRVGGEDLPLLDDRRPAVAVGTAQHQHVRTGLGQAGGATDGPIHFHQAGVGPAEGQIVGQRQIVRDHKRASAVLLEFRSHPGQRQIIADDELRRAGTIGQNDPLAEQPGQTVAGGVSLTAGPAEVEHHIGLAGRRRELALPIRVRGELAGPVRPHKIRDPRVVQDQVIAIGLEGPEAVVGVVKAAQDQIEIVRRKIHQPAGRAGNRQRVAAVRVEIDSAERAEIDRKGRPRRRRIREQAADRQQVPRRAGRPVEIRHIHHILAAAGPDVGPGDRQIAHPAIVRREGRAAADQHHSAAQPHRAGATQGGIRVQGQPVLHKRRPAAQHAEVGRRRTIAHGPATGIGGQRGVQHRQAPSVEHQLPAAGDRQIAGQHRPCIELEGPAVIHPHGRIAAGPGHADGGPADHQRAAIGHQRAHGPTIGREGPGPRSHLAQRPAAGDERPAKIRAPIPPPDLHRAAAEVDPAAAREQPHCSIVLEIHLATARHPHRHPVGQRRHAPPVERPAAADQQIAAAHHLPAHRQHPPIDHCVASVRIGPRQCSGAAAGLRQRAAAAEIPAVGRGVVAPDQAHPRAVRVG